MLGYMRAWISKDGHILGLCRKADDPGPTLPDPGERDGLHWTIKAQHDDASETQVMREAALDMGCREWAMRHRKASGGLTPWYWEERAYWYGRVYIAPAVNGGKDVFLDYDANRECADNIQDGVVRYEEISPDDPDRQEKLAKQREKFEKDATDGKVVNLTDLLANHGV